MKPGFILPSCPGIRRVDRFGLVDCDDDEVPFWDLLTAVLRSDVAPIKDVSSLLEALEIIAVTLRGTAAGVDFSLLRDFMTRRFREKSGPNFFRDIWPVLVDLALEMANLFPDGLLPSLSSTEITEIIFSRKQVACLVIHQFLCSLPPHPWSTESFVDLSPLYSEANNVHRGAVDAYLTALFTYFERIVGYSKDSTRVVDSGTKEWPISFSMRTMTHEDIHRIQDNQAKITMLSATRVNIVNLPESQTTPRFLGLPDGACVISANKSVGYGPSGTQEELNVGSTPEAYPVVLLAPPLSDQQVLICRGAEAMVSIIGYGRDARLGDVLQETVATSDGLGWNNRTMLFMDALELDTLTVEGDRPIPDISPSSRLSREMILKAYNAFSSGTYSHVVTGLWGCGTFGGNKYVKCIIQWCAAALAGVPELRFVFSTPDQHKFGEELAQLVASLLVNPASVYRMVHILVDLKAAAHGVGPDGIFRYISEKILQQ
ncbi:hypothetical protein ASPSYDRAFT_49933 [Aspergillus sydowii CBS 593.65]|uniref:poly(ADP-ribose) glycohydrolase n=1 Tax=Aspergillus sydowii CBS 593.65 TaxID=1036612 RepID=A0A1L9T5W5_9EURO|nr:uncharacterized protein ASPSYDRAFT_49933 [Aspergillus sydowii CBS 593.65]OJJ54850.1 hypothetical protein ASPSYDRAFT_49933 [Aspergillus sydowii CBS 593.65]